MRFCDGAAATPLSAQPPNLIFYCDKHNPKAADEIPAIALSGRGPRKRLEYQQTAAARQLHTSQPGVSRQLKLLEEELGFQLFEREGRALTRTTDAGEEIISRAASILREMQNIRRTSAELRKADGGTLSIATTHTQARYVLPEVIRAFRFKYPKVRLHLHQGTSEQIAEMVARDRVDFAIATGSDEQFPHLVRLPVYRWHRAVVVPRGHPLASAGKLTLKKLAEYPIVTYVFSISGRSSLPALFETAGLSLDVALTARDST